MQDTFRGFSFGGGNGTTTALSTSFAVIGVGKDTTNAPRSTKVPDACMLTFLDFQLNTIAGGATELTFKITRDAAGDVPLLVSSLTGSTQTIEVGETTSADGGVSFGLNMDYVRDSGTLADSTADQLFIWAKLNAGTANVNCRLGWRAG